MTHQILKVESAYLLKQTTRVYILDVDTAVDFAAWLQQQGFTVEMSDGEPASRSPEETFAAHALTEMYARARA